MTERMLCWLACKLQITLSNPIYSDTSSVAAEVIENPAHGAGVPTLIHTLAAVELHRNKVKKVNIAITMSKCNLVMINFYDGPSHSTFESRPSYAVAPLQIIMPKYIIIIDYS